MKTASFDDFINEKIKDFCGELSGARICIDNGKICFECIRAKYDRLSNSILFHAFRRRLRHSNKREVHFRESPATILCLKYWG